MTIISWVCSIPRTFDTLSKGATLSAFFTFISVLLAAIFAGIEKHPAGYNPDPNHIDPVSGLKMGGEPTVLAVPLAGTTFVAGMNAFLNISYTFIGQITLPSFIAEMKEPKDFKKALWIVTIAEILVFSLVGAVVYAYTVSRSDHPRVSTLSEYANLKSQGNSIQHCPGLLLPGKQYLQDRLIFLHDPHSHLSRCPLRLRLSTLRLLPYFRQQQASHQPHCCRLGNLDRHLISDMDFRFHYCRSHPILCGLAESDELAV